MRASPPLADEGSTGPGARRRRDLNGRAPSPRKAGRRACPRARPGDGAKRRMRGCASVRTLASASISIVGVAPHPSPLPASGARGRATVSSPRKAGRRACPRARPGDGAKRRMRGCASVRTLASASISIVRAAPHPSPLPASGARGRATVSSPRKAGRRACPRARPGDGAKRRMRGCASLRTLASASISIVGAAPHPSPLPASGARGF